MQRQMGRREYKGVQGSCGGDGYVHFLDFGNSFPGFYICLTYDIIHFKCTLFYVTYTQYSLKKIVVFQFLIFKIKELG